MNLSDLISSKYIVPIALFALVMGFIAMDYTANQHSAIQPTIITAPVPYNRAVTQLAWTTFELYSNYTGGTALTTNGISTVTMLNYTNSTFYLSPSDHRLVSMAEVYLLRYMRFNVSDSTATVLMTLSISSDSGAHFFNISDTKTLASGTNMRDYDAISAVMTVDVGNSSDMVNTTLTAAKAPLAFTGNDIVRFDVSSDKNSTVKIETFGSY